MRKEAKTGKIVRLWVREGVIPAHRKEGGRKLSSLRHEIFEWHMASWYVSGEG